MLTVRNRAAALSEALKASLGRAHKGLIEVIFSISLFIQLSIRNKE